MIGCNALQHFFAQLIGGSRAGVCGSRADVCAYAYVQPSAKNALEPLCASVTAGCDSLRKPCDRCRAHWRGCCEWRLAREVARAISMNECIDRPEGTAGRHTRAEPISKKSAPVRVIPQSQDLYLSADFQISGKRAVVHVSGQSKQVDL